MPTELQNRAAVDVAVSAAERTITPERTCDDDICDDSESRLTESSDERKIVGITFTPNNTRYIRTQ